MKLNRLDKFFWRVSITSILVVGVLVFLLIGWSEFNKNETPVKAPSDYVVEPSKPKVKPNTTSRDTGEDATELDDLTNKLKQVRSSEFTLFTLDYWYADEDVTFDDGTTCQSSTESITEYVGSAIKRAWERIPGNVQLRFDIGKLVYCSDIKQGNQEMSLLTRREANSLETDVFFSIPSNVAKTPKAIQRVFFIQLFTLAEQQFGQTWAMTWDEKFGQPVPEKTLQHIDYPDSRTERAAWFAFFMQDKDAMYKQVMLSRNTVLIEKMGTMQSLLSTDWQTSIDFSSAEPPSTIQTVQNTPPAQPISVAKKHQGVSQARRSFDAYIAQTYPQGTSSVKNITAKEAEKAFGIKGLQFAANNFAPDLPFKLGFAHIDVDIRGYNCKSTTPFNTAMSGRYLEQAWQQISPTVQKNLGLKFVFFCSELLSPQGWQMGGLATSFHDTVFIRIPEYNAQNNKFVQKIFFHELFHYAEFRSRRFFNHSWENVFTGYANSYRKDLNNAIIGSGKRGFLNAYSMSFSAEERAELFSELMVNPKSVERYLERKKDTVLEMKVARMKQIMQINWGVKR